MPDLNLPNSQQLNVNIKGVVIPTWLASCLLLTAILAAISLLLGWRQNVLVERELRILQVQISDVENVLIRQGIATRDDFMTRDENSQHSENPGQKVQIQPNRKE